MIRSKEAQSEIIIDLTGPQGNAFSLMGYAMDIGKKLGLSKLAIDGIIQEMQMSDYEHLVQTFDKHFGDYVILER